jgi:hypothetical protein
MTDFWTDEKSLQDGRPVELHEFHARGTGTYWRYADAPLDVTYGGNVFVARYIEGEAIQQGSNALKNQTTVKCDWDCPYAAQYQIAAPEEVIDYARYKTHDATNFICSFVGVVIAVRFRQENRAGNRYVEIMIDPASNDLRESGLILRAGRQCQVPLYGPECGILRSGYRTSGIVATVSFTTITSSVFAGEPTGWFLGGDFVTGRGRRKIVYHLGSTIKLARALSGLLAGDAFDAYAGCDHTCSTCDVKFNNLLNFRGQPLIPDGDPWGDALL